MSRLIRSTMAPVLAGLLALAPAAASSVAVGGDPLDAISSLRRPLVVLQAGRVALDHRPK